MAKSWLVTQQKLDRALVRVRRELVHHGFWHPSTAAVCVRLIPLASCHAYYVGFIEGEIHVPAISLCRMWAMLHREYFGLTDVLRHEYGHALCWSWPGLFFSRRFSSAFGGSVKSTKSLPYDPEQLHLSAYAAKNPEETFCETFAAYLRTKGQLPARWRGTLVERQWSFIDSLPAAIRSERRRWT